MHGLSEPDRDCSRASVLRTTPPFVGRHQELAWIEQSIQAAIDGRPRVVLLAGDAGIGKTRLLKAVQSVASRRGVRVCYGRCYEDLPLPYLPFIEAFLAHLDPVPEDVARVLGVEAQVISQFLHRSREAMPAANSPDQARAEQDQLRLFVTLAQATLALAQRCPTLLVVDDLHWADPPSLDLFGHLVFTMADTAMREPVPLLICGTYRPAEPGERLSRLIARLQREDICHTLTVPGLDEAEIRELIQRLGLARPSQQLVATVSTATQGNPLFIQEVVHHLIQQGALQERHGYVVTTSSAADLRLPDQVTGALAARTLRLSERCRHVLTLGACLSDDFSLRVLGAVSGVAEEELLDLLEEAISQHLLLNEGQSFQFAHSLIRHVFYRDLSAVRRQRLHRQIAQALERLYADSQDAHVLEIAHHVVRAGTAAAGDTVVAYARRAGDQAFAMSAWGDAARYYEAALSAAESAGHLASKDRADLHYWAGRAHYRDQDVGPCLDQYEQAIAAYRLAGNVPGLARALMEKTRVHFTLASVPYGTLVDIQPLEEITAALGDSEPELRGSIAATMSLGYWSARQPHKAEEMAQRALAIGQDLQNEPLCANAGFALGLAQYQSLQMPEALQSWQQAAASARKADDLWLQGYALTRLPMTLAWLGQLDDAEAVAADARELIRKTHDWGNYSLTLAALASMAVIRGDFEAAEERTHETMVMVSRSRYPWGGVLALPTLAYARALRGAWAEARDAIDMLVEPGRVFEEAGPSFQADARVYRQLLQAYAAACEDTTPHVTTHAQELIGQRPLDMSSLASFCAIVEMSDLLAAPAMAEALYHQLLRAAERGVLFSPRWAFLIPRILGIAAGLNRWWDTAETHFQTAIDVATRLGARPELARSYLDYARMLAARGSQNGRRRAINLLRHASPILQELGMEPFMRRAAQLARALKARIPLPSPSRTAYPAKLSEREVEILLQLAQGRTHQQIADELVLSPETITGHARRLFNKIGVSGQSAAAAYAVEQGLALHPLPGQGTQRTSVGAHPAGKGEVAQRQTPLPPTPALRIILVTDMEGSTELIQRLGDAQAHDLMRHHTAIMRECLRQYHGVEVTHTGDGVEASFASAANAVECAIAIQKAFARHNQEHPDRAIRVRMGINAGEPIVTGGQLFGTAIHAAFRICSRAQPLQILVSDVVRQLAVGKGLVFIDRGRIALKGFSERVRLYEVQWQEGPA